jgi:hypothetical protein
MCNLRPKHLELFDKLFDILDPNMVLLLKEKLESIDVQNISVITTYMIIIGILVTVTSIFINKALDL